MRVCIKCEVLLLVLVCGLQLASMEEFVDRAFTGNFGEVLIRYGLCFIGRMYFICFFSAMFLNLVCSKVYYHLSDLVSCICRCKNVMYLGGVLEDEDAAKDDD